MEVIQVGFITHRNIKGDFLETEPIYFESTEDLKKRQSDIIESLEYIEAEYLSKFIDEKEVKI